MVKKHKKRERERKRKIIKRNNKKTTRKINYNKINHFYSIELYLFYSSSNLELMNNTFCLRKCVNYDDNSAATDAHMSLHLLFIDSFHMRNIFRFIRQIRNDINLNSCFLFYFILFIFLNDPVWL
jgi:hypothetical protein